jgi:hypothetical protein
MSLRRWQFGLIVIAMSLVISSRSASAAAPTIIMIYGEPLQKPIFVVLKQGEVTDSMSTYGFFFQETGRTTPTEMSDRPYLSTAMFYSFKEWAAYTNHSALLTQLRPEQASQHGRLYLPTASEPAVVLVTRFRNLDPVPIPSASTAFINMAPLGRAAIETVRRLGIPGF